MDLDINTLIKTASDLEEKGARAKCPKGVYLTTNNLAIAFETCGKSIFPVLSIHLQKAYM